MARKPPDTAPAPDDGAAGGERAANRKAFALRMREDVYELVRRWADDEFRSVNAQIEFLLRDALKRANRLPPRGQDEGQVR